MVWVVIVVVIGSVAESSFGVVAGGKDGGLRKTVVGCIVLDSLVVTEVGGSRWHPGSACRIVWGWKILSSFVVLAFTT